MKWIAWTAVAVGLFPPTGTYAADETPGQKNPPPAVAVVNAFPGLRFKNPIRIRNRNDGSNRLFVGSQLGVIYGFRNSAEATDSGKKLFLKLPPRHQLMDFMFHPDHANNGYVYTYYRDGGERAGRSVLSRFQVDSNDADRVDPASEKVILEIKRPFHPGSIQFGPDGLLYFVLGYEFYYPDMNPDQTTDPLDNYSHFLGTMLRIDVDHEGKNGRAYRIPADNPFRNDDRIPDEVWAYGFREPWRFCFHPKTGDCWLGDNGQWAYEEVNLVLSGAYYGWPAREGFLPFNEKFSRKSRGGMEKGATFRFGGAPVPGSEFVDPLIEYPHRVGVCVVGGEFYFGELIPEMTGEYVYGDFQYGKIWSMQWNGTEVVANRQISQIPANLTSFGKDEGGEIYLTAFDGKIYRLERKSAEAGSPPE